VTRPDDPEVAVVQGGDGGCPEALGDGHDTGVDQPEAQVGISLNQARRPLPAGVGEVLAAQLPRGDRPQELGFGDRLANVGELPETDLAALLNVLDSLVAKNRLKALAGGLS
jgi:hypothetical protein